MEPDLISVYSGIYLQQDYINSAAFAIVSEESKAGAALEAAADPSNLSASTEWLLSSRRRGTGQLACLEFAVAQYAAVGGMDGDIPIRGLTQAVEYHIAETR